MELVDKIKQISQNIDKQLPYIHTEEATKTAFVMPFLSALGYEIFNPQEVIPEFVADVGVKKGEKVDYALKKDGQVIILIECKHHEDTLSIERTSQLYRYFSVTESRFAIITNGLIYRFFSDLESPNKMDSKPFFEFDIRRYNDSQIVELKKFEKPSFDLEKILSTANDLKYVGAIRKILEKEFSSPSETFVRFLAGSVYNGRFTKNVQEQFETITKKSLAQFINEKINNKLQSALANTLENEVEVNKESNNNGIITTDTEIEGYHIIKAICREIISVTRIVGRDTKSYFGVLLDNNNRKPICRLHFNRSQKYLGIFDKDKNEIRHPIDTLEDIYSYANEIKATIRYFDAEN